MKTIFISDFKPGLVIDRELFGIINIIQAEDKNGKTYYDLELVDKTGTIKAKIWSDTLAKIGKIDLEVGKVAALSATVQEFRGSLQLNILDINLISDSDYALEDFQVKTNKDIKLLKSTVDKYIKSIKDKDLREVIQGIIKKHQQEYFMTPAAKVNHHHYLGGLAEHVVEMLEISDTVLTHYPEANQDYVYAGIIMHDIGKIKELDYQNFATKYTAIGKLIGHISLGVGMLDNYLFANHPQLLNSMKIYLLKHIILSHHGKLEFGSPVLPKTIEAAIVSNIDELSAKSRSFQRILTKHNKNDIEFSQHDLGVGTEVYVKRIDDLEDDSENDEQQRLV